MANDMEARRQFMLRLFDTSLEYVRVEIGSEQYSPLGTADMVPCLSMIKYARPDVVIAYFSPEAHHITIFKQIMEIDGWGDVNLVNTSLVLTSSAPKMPGTVASHRYAPWAGGLPYPGVQKSQQDILAKRSRLPRPPQVRHYVCFWTAVSAIEMAGTGATRTRPAAASLSRSRLQRHL